MLLQLNNNAIVSILLWLFGVLCLESRLRLRSSLTLQNYWEIKIGSLFRGLGEQLHFLCYLSCPSHTPISYLPRAGNCIAMVAAVHLRLQILQPFASVMMVKFSRTENSLILYVPVYSKTVIHLTHCLLF